MSGSELAEFAVAERAGLASASDHEPPRMPSGGLISMILGHVVEPSGDDGARAALRTLPRRASPDLDYTDPVGAEQRIQARIDLLLTLAPNQAPATRSRILTQAAELLLQQGERERAVSAYADAVAADRTNRLAALQLRRQHIKDGRLAEAAELFKAVGETASDARERCLAWCALAEIESRIGASDTRVIEILQRATRANRASLAAWLLLAERQLRAGLVSEFAASLREAASVADAPRARALLLLEAGRGYERTAHADLAFACYQEATTADEAAIGPLLGHLRLQNAAGDREGAADTLGKLAEIAGAGALRDEWTRQRGLLQLDTLSKPAAALATMQALHTVTGLRALTRAAEAAGDREAHQRAYEAWSQASGGALRTAAHTEQARARTRQQVGARKVDAVEQKLSEAQASLRRAALLCGTAGSVADERKLLGAVTPDESAYVSADIVACDLAAEGGDVPQLSAAVTRAIARWPENLRAGPLFAALDLDTRDRSHPERSPHWQSLLRIAHGHPVITRYLATRASSPEQSARLWLTEAVAAYGEHAAYAATNAARYLEIAKLDPTEAYADALDAVRGYLPAAFGLEAAARARGDLGALERVHRELADRNPAAQERVARQVRLGLLNADSDASAAAYWLGLAAQSAQDDAVLDELAVRLAMDQSPAHRAQLLEAAAARHAGAGEVRALQLRAAEAHEAAGQWDDAIRLYRAQLKKQPNDVFTDCALLAALRKSGHLDDLAEELDMRVRNCSDSARGTVLLEDLANVEQARGHVQLARMQLERVVQARPGGRAISALRALQRHALQTENEARILQWSLQLSEALEEPAARAAELRLALRACRRLGGDVSQALLSAEGRIHELWYARELEALAIRTGDRVRLYEALCMQAELAHGQGAQERGAYAFRAAEVMENAAPARAARDLADALLSASSHPLAIEQLARLYKAAGDTTTAAQTFERAAHASHTPRRAASLHYTAALLFQDELNQPERAIDNLAASAKADLLLGDTFGRLRYLYQNAGRRQDRLALIDARLQLPLEPHLAKELHWERYTLCLELGQPAAAKQSLLNVLQDGRDPRALAALIELQIRLGEHAAAAESSLSLVNVLQDHHDAETLLPVLLRLAGLYERELRDPQRAEDTLQRALEVAPEDARVLENMAWLHARLGRKEAALATLSFMRDTANSPAAHERYIVQRSLLLEQLGQSGTALEELAEAQLALPTSMALVRARTALLDRQGDEAALSDHLARACAAQRNAIEQNPGDIEPWLGLCELLRQREQDASALLVAQTARALGHQHADLPNEQPRGLGAPVLQEEMLTRLSPRGAIVPLRVLMAELGYVLDKVTPFAPPTEPSAPDLAQPLAAQVARLFGMTELEDMTVLSCEPALCLPLSATPLRLCVGRQWFSAASSAERLFAFTRAIAIAKFDLALFARSTPERLGLVLGALRQVADRGKPIKLTEAAEQQRIIDSFGKRFGMPQRARAQNLFDEIETMGEDVSPRRLIALTYDAGTRVALSMTGDVQAAFACLLRMHGRDPNTCSHAEKLELTRSDPALRGLLEFALSESYGEVLRDAAQLGAAGTN
jgi:tetratricopeptide (TPR) repeat protein